MKQVKESPRASRQSQKLTAKLYQEGANKAKDIWRKSDDLGCEYGAIEIPMHDIYSGELVNLQTILMNGNSRFIDGARVLGTYTPIGRPKNNQIIVCRSYSVGMTLFEETGNHAIAVAFSDVNMIPVSLMLRAKYPSYYLIIAADRNEKSKTCARIASAVSGSCWTHPDVPDSPVYEDIRDYTDLAFITEAVFL